MKTRRERQIQCLSPCVLTLLDSTRLILSSTDLVLRDLVDPSPRLGGPTRLVTSPTLDVACSIKQVVRLCEKAEV
jgi:hypothetical protein